MDDEIGPSTVTLSRSEGSVAQGVEMLRCAQHDSAVTHKDSWIHLLKGISGDGRIQTY